MQNEKELIELYLELLEQGPGYRSDIEFWDPTGDAVAIFEELRKNYIPNNGNV